ncbi:GMC family oxidoreductase N-terminal domain-containing protein [Streptomyces sp. NPDC006261]|uniref:GMC family oxidoreductase N-terminal domain-containing protein n=1 Tax=Streptomyces sp. NPDC006261 TaxID=3156739 RepID=UPI0033B4F13A
MDRAHRRQHRPRHRGAALHLPPRGPSPLSAAFLAACRSGGLPQLPELNVPEHSGCSLTPLNQRRSRRWSAADGYLKRAARWADLDILTGARVALTRAWSTTRSRPRLRDRWGGRHPARHDPPMTEAQPHSAADAAPAPLRRRTPCGVRAVTAVE